MAVTNSSVGTVSTTVTGGNNPVCCAFSGTLKRARAALDAQNGDRNPEPKWERLLTTAPRPLAWNARSGVGNGVDSGSAFTVNSILDLKGFSTAWVHWRVSKPSSTTVERRQH